jgi:hypothetical protein
LSQSRKTTAVWFWTSVGGRLSHYNASLQVFAGDNGGSKILWIADLLPNELEGTIQSMIDAAAVAMKKTLDAKHS